jgi:hypothetical protein
MTQHIAIFDAPLSPEDFARVTAGFPAGCMKPTTLASARDVMNSVYFARSELSAAERCVYIVDDDILAMTLKLSIDPRAILPFEEPVVSRCSDWSGVVSRLMTLVKSAEDLEQELDAHRKWMKRETPTASKAQDAILPQRLSDHLYDDLTAIRGEINQFLDAYA